MSKVQESEMIRKIVDKPIDRIKIEKRLKKYEDLLNSSIMFGMKDYICVYTGYIEALKWVLKQYDKEYEKTQKCR